MSESPSPHPDDAAFTTEHVVHAALRFLRLAWRRKGTLLLSLGLAALLGGLYYFTAQPVYRAGATLLVTHTGADVLNNQAPGGFQQSFVPTYEKLLTSRVVLTRALARLEESAGSAGAGSGGAAAGEWPAAGVDPLLDFRSLPRNKWLEGLQQSLRTGTVRGTNLIEVSYCSAHREAARAVVSAVVEAYLDFMEENHRSVAAEVGTLLENERRGLEERIGGKEGELLEARRRLRDLGLRHNPTAVHPVVQRAIQLNDSWVKARQQRSELAASRAAIEAAVARGGDVRQHLAALQPMVGRELLLATLGLSAQDGEVLARMEQKRVEDEARLAMLDEHYGPNHPRVVELRLAVENARRYLHDFQRRSEARAEQVTRDQLGTLLLTMVGEELERATLLEDRLRADYEQAEAEALALNHEMTELSILEHDLTQLRNLHDTLVERIARIDINQNQAEVRAAVVGEPAAAPRPVSPRLALTGLLALAAGLGGGLLLVYVLDVLDDRFRSPEELQRQLGAAVLAIVRRLPAGDGEGIEGVLMHRAPEAAECEAFRTLRTAVVIALDGARRLAFTSSEPGDGKTTVVANLAAACAQGGRRTLVIDADLRRPGLTRLLGLRGLAGLADLLLDPRPVAAAALEWIVPSGAPRCDVLPCGGRPRDPAQLLASPRFAELLDWAETHYDLVILDTPPVLAASDAVLAGRLAEGVLLVVQPEKNHRRLVLRAADSLAALRVPLRGVVVNRAAAGRDRGYDGYDYGYGYGMEYGEEEREAPNLPAPAVGGQQPRRRAA